ncbi:unnamed protein product [Sympodiomycopsis kandeliae]
MQNGITEHQTTAPDEVSGLSEARVASTSISASPPPDQHAEGATTEDASGAPLSKNALKKKLKREAWEAGKADRRILSRERRKRQRENQRAKKKELIESGEAGPSKRIKKCIFDAHVVIDCGFDEGMSEKETHSMAQQLSFCYASNKRASNPFRSLIFSGPSARSEILSVPENDDEEDVKREANPSSSLEGYTKLLEESSQTGVAIPFSASRTGKQMAKMGDSQYLRWKNVSVVEQGGLEALLSDESSRTPPIDLSSCIYLTADTEETIESLEEGKTYIIGGIVDRNRYKNLCLQRAQRLGMKVAKLPINPENLGGKIMNSRKVLTVNQVFDILLGWTNQLHPQNRVEGQDPNWREALMKGLPGRKFLENQQQEQTGVQEGEDTSIATDILNGVEADGEPAMVKRSLSPGSQDGEQRIGKEARTD